MSESPSDPPASPAPAPAGPESPPTPPAPSGEAGAPAVTPEPRRELSVRALLEAGAHFGHQTRRWNPRMRPYLYGERNGIHIIDLDRTLEHLREALDFLRETVAAGGRVLFVGTKRQAQAPVKLEAERAGQFYVNNRWLGGMLTNWRTVRRSIERFKDQLGVLEDEERAREMNKKELSWVSRSVTKYRKSLDGIKEMTRLPDALFVIDLAKEHIAVQEARRLGIPIVGIVDSNCNPSGIEFVVPGNDDAIRAIQLYCSLAADACLEGAELYNERVQAEVSEEAAGRGGAEAPRARRRVVDVRPSGGGRPAARGARGGRGGGRRLRQPGGAISAGGGPGAERRSAAPASGAEETSAEAPEASAGASEAAGVSETAGASEAPERREEGAAPAAGGTEGESAPETGSEERGSEESSG